MTTPARDSLPDWPEYLSIRELGRYLGISFRTLESWKRAGHLPPHYEFGKRHHRWKRSEIDVWVQTYLVGGEVSR